ncbi:hypothetical protein AOQ84DRAFT_440712 [Glonium stellatum]|uniref:Uncharacterized protein n=1 Tax=Glonium stellatum TaxID=574774 RepID=A0A8E2JR74_9PEZI|nr:hypothetical protein AOQ84DRAFT_440712 [Glonium stellatum]
MILQRHILRQAQSTFWKAEVCIWCRTRQFLDRPIRRNAFTLRKAPSTRLRERRKIDLAIPQHRDKLLQRSAAVDRLTREAFLNKAFEEHVIPIDQEAAESHIQRYLETDFDTIFKESSLSLADISQIAYILCKAPTKGSREIGKRMLLDASAAGDTNATLRFAASVHSSEAADADSIVRYMQSSDLRSVRVQLERLAYNDGNPDAMVLLGQLLEREGKDEEPLKLYRAAVDAIQARRKDINARDDSLGNLFKGTTPQHRDPLPIPAPWTALGTLLLQRRGDLKGAKEAFTLGALKADDPLAYFYLTEFEEKHSANWLDYTIKAAASGHRDAAYNLGKFYMLKRSVTEKTADATVRKHLSWLDSYKSWTGFGLLGSTRKMSGRTGMAWEWYQIAACGGHKMAAIELAKRCRTTKEWEAAAKYLVIAMRKSPRGPEEWPAAVKEAQELRRLWSREDSQAERTELQDIIDEEIERIEEMKRGAQR